MTRLLKTLTRVHSASHSPAAPRAFPRLEELESRLVLSYTPSGNAWPNPQLITLSFVPDGTNLGGVTSNLFSVFNAKFGSASAWQNVILKAAQVWAQQTNLNFAVVGDSGAAIGSGNYQQGDPAMGDIRIGGYNFGTSALGVGYMPPPVDNYSIAGDVAFNTGQNFNINGSNYDLFTVAAHEIGHALGLNHYGPTVAIMNAAYTSRKTALSSDDIQDIRLTYTGGNNPRAYDAYSGTNTSFASAANLSSLIDGNGIAVAPGLNIANTSLQEYFTITAPADTTGTMTVTVQSSGLSLLAPTLTVYNSSQTQIGYVSGAGQYGTTLTLNIAGVTAGQPYYVKVAGADTTSFGTGAYALTFAFDGIAAPPVLPPNTQVLNGTPIHGGGGQNLDSGSNPHGSGCTCPMCRGAVASVQQLQVLTPTLLQDAENPGSEATPASTSHVALLDLGTRQAVADAWGAGLDKSLAGSLGETDLASASWAQACDALFAEDAWVADGELVG